MTTFLSWSSIDIYSDSDGNRPNWLNMIYRVCGMVQSVK